ncbi:hypothetical protein BC940DRAFT_311492 [Gongronella butleri]|nr:hypothetical protein BC940DRAFT_311492 [Gongronella butleri]
MTNKATALVSLLPVLKIGFHPAGVRIRICRRPKADPNSRLIAMARRSPIQVFLIFFW